MTKGVFFYTYSLFYHRFEKKKKNTDTDDCYSLRQKILKSDFISSCPYICFYLWSVWLDTFKVFFNSAVYAESSFDLIWLKLSGSLFPEVSYMYGRPNIKRSQVRFSRND